MEFLEETQVIMRNFHISLKLVKDVRTWTIALAMAFATTARRLAFAIWVLATLPILLNEGGT